MKSQFRHSAGIFKDQKGMSLAQVLVGAAMAGAAVLALAYQFQSVLELVKRTKFGTQAVELRFQALSQISDNSIVKTSLLEDSVWRDCLDGSGSCPVGRSPLVIRNFAGGILFDNASDEGFDKNGASCDLATQINCIYKLEFFSTILCEAAACGGSISLILESEVVQFQQPPLAGRVTLSSSARLFSTTGVAPIPLVSSGLSLSLTTLAFVNADGTINGFGFNYYSYIDGSGATFVAVPKALEDVFGNVIVARSFGDLGSGHNILARDDGTVWTIGRNTMADLAQPGTTIIKDSQPHFLQLYDFAADGTPSLSPQLTRIPLAEGSPSDIPRWRKVAGVLGDPAVADVVKVYATASAFNLVIRANGEVWGAGKNNANRMGLPTAALGPQNYTDPYGASVVHSMYWDDQFPDGTLPSPTSRADEAAIQSQSRGNVAKYGDPVGFLAPFVPHPKYVGLLAPPAPIETAGLINVFEKSFYLGRDVDFELIDVALGSYHGCALNQHGNVVCWGSNLFGTLGRGTMKDDIDFDNIGPTNPWTPGDPVATPVVKRMAKYYYGGRIDGGDYFVRGPFQSPWDTPGGTPNGVGAPADFHRVVVDTAGTPLENIVSISGSVTHTCALQNTGKVFCWGGNHGGQLSRGIVCSHWAAQTFQGFSPACRESDVAKPMLDAGGVEFTDATNVIVGDTRTYIVTAAGKLFAAGYQSVPNEYFLGFGGASFNYSSAQELPGAYGRVIDVATSVKGKTQTSCLLNDIDELWCWGLNHSGDPTQAKFILGGAAYYLTPTLIPIDITN